MSEWCNCESLVCKMPHADGSRESRDPAAWSACPNPSRDDLRILYIGPVCEGCYKSYPAEYRVARNPTARDDWWGGDMEHAVEDLWLYIENTGELYEMKKRILADPRVYDERLAPLLWLAWVNRGARYYVYEMIQHGPMSKIKYGGPSPDLVDDYIPPAIREELARQIAEHERTRLLVEKGYAPPVKRVIYMKGQVRKNPRRVVYHPGGVIRPKRAADCGGGELQRIAALGARTRTAGNYSLGSTRIWYARPEFGRDLRMGVEWLKEQNLMPSADAIEKTHICLGEVAEIDLEMIYFMMQAETWSPMGEARSYIMARGLRHTSMSVGDVIERGGRFFIVDSVGFDEFV